MIVHCQDWVFSVQKVAYLIFISMMMACLSDIYFNDDSILKMINKTHGHDNISIRMVKICDKTIIKPLSIIYKNCIDTGIYSQIYGRNLILFQFIRKEINNCYKITDQLLCYLFLEIFLRKFKSIQYLNIYKTITCFVKISLFFNHLIHVNTSFS